MAVSQHHKLRLIIPLLLRIGNVSGRGSLGKPRHPQSDGFGLNLRLDTFNVTEKGDGGTRGKQVGPPDWDLFRDRGVALVKPQSHVGPDPVIPRPHPPPQVQPADLL